MRIGYYGLMENGVIKIGVFAALDEISLRHEISAQKWAEVSGLKHGSRIAELRAMAYDRREVPDRAFHYKKFIQLKQALADLIGEETVRRELTELLKKTEDKDEKLVLLASNLKDLPDHLKDHAIDYLERLAKEIVEKKK